MTLRPLATSCAKDYKGQSLVQTSFTEPPNKALSVQKHAYRGWAKVGFCFHSDTVHIAWPYAAGHAYWFHNTEKTNTVVCRLLFTGPGGFIKKKIIFFCVCVCVCPPESVRLKLVLPLTYTYFRSRYRYSQLFHVTCRDDTFLALAD